MTGMVILGTDVLSTNRAVLSGITIPVIQMFCPLMKQYSLVFSFCCTDVLSTSGAVLTSITIPVIQMWCPLMKQYSSTASLVDGRTSVQLEW
jgi:hypothetical protein